MITGDNEIYEASADGLVKIGLRGHRDPEARRGHTGGPAVVPLRFQ